VSYYSENRERLLARAKAHYAANRERIREQRARHYAEHRDEINARARAKHAENPEIKRERGRRWRAANNARLREHGLTPEQYDSLLSEQARCCAICDQPFAAVPRIDHDHRTGEVRGLLCHNCNVALGHFRDNPVLLRRAIHYLDTVPFYRWAEQRPSKGEPYAPAGMEAAA
jgi:hypothetical protein